MQKPVPDVARTREQAYYVQRGGEMKRLASIVAAVAAVTALVGSASAAESSYTVTKLVSDQPGVALHQDPDLVNAWGLTARPTSPWWVADNETNLSTLYRGDGTKVFLPGDVAHVNVPNAPTGAASNTGSNFVVTNGTTSAPAVFLFDTEEGKILGWAPSVSVTDAQVAVDNTGAGAIYKGLAISSAGDMLYAADFHNARVDVFNGSFQPVNNPGAFVDPGIPSGYAPFGIQNIGGTIFVTYAKQDADGEDDVAGQGHGFVDRFSANGDFLGRVATRGQLNSPWGLAMAPAGFGRFGDDLLVGNFGDGEISAFEPQSDGSYELVGQLRTSEHKVLTIDGLWALQFGRDSANNGSSQTLFFTAGPDDESHGLFGTITAG
jgi:uncharacterized protein (TIGR03118 family)